MKNYISDYNSDLIQKYVRPEPVKDSYDALSGGSKSPNFKKYCEFGALSRFDDSRQGKIYEIPVR